MLTVTRWQKIKGLFDCDSENIRKSKVLWTSFIKQLKIHLMPHLFPPELSAPTVVARRRARQRSLTGLFFINGVYEEAEGPPAVTNEGSVRVSALTDDFGREAADKTLWSERRARTKGKQLCCTIAVLHDQHHSSFFTRLSFDFISLHFSLFIWAQPPDRSLIHSFKKKNCFLLFLAS